MNVVDPERSAAFFAGVFPTTRVTTFAGAPALRSEDVLILFRKVRRPAAHSWNTALWHIGWNSPVVAADHQRIAAGGARFFRVPPPSGHFISPDGVDIEIAPQSATGGGSTPTAFNHVHLMSAAPLCAADWYVAVLGLRRGPQTGRVGPDCHAPMAPRGDPGNQILSPSARVYAGEIMIAIHPNQGLETFSSHPLKRPPRLVSSRGHVLDRIAFVAPDLEGQARRLRALGVRIIEPARVRDGRRSLVIEGPDAIIIELMDSSAPGAHPATRQ